MKLYLVSWTGGYEAPQYVVRPTLGLAMRLAEKWARDMEEGVDTIDVLEIDADALSVRRIEAEEIT